MKISLSEIAETEKYLLHEMRPGQRLVFQAKLLTNGDLRRDTFFHNMAHRMIRLYQRKKIKAEIEAAYERLFTDPEKASFREEILKLFKS